MSITRENAEYLVQARVDPLMTAADMEVTAVDVSVDLNDPLGRALRILGYTVANPILVSDTDVAQVTDAKLDEFLDHTTLYTLWAILGNLDDVDITVGPRTEKLSQLAAQVERKIALLQKAMADRYSYGMATPVAGVITRDIAEHD